MKRILALLLVLCMAFSLVACGGNNETDTKAESNDTESDTNETEGETGGDETVTVMTHAEYEAAAMDSAVVIEAYVQAAQGWWQDSETGKGQITVYLQAEDGAYFAYNMACSEENAAKLTKGTKIRVSGYKGEFSGEIEILDATFEILEGNWVAEAMDATALLGTDDLIKHQNKFVSFKGMKVEASKDANGNDVPFLYNWDGSGSEGNDLYFNVSVNGKTYNFTVESYLCGKDTDVYKAVQGLQIGDVIDMEGFLYWYNGVNPHITAVSK